jgi:two-component system, cell cycle sensor histidine kinase and response regulator CckA
MDGRIVLVVDDDPMIRDLVARAITGAGYRVLTAGDGEEALAVASTLDGQLALVVTDVRMPVMDGIAMAAQLTGSNPRLPVLFISGYAPEAKGALPGPVLPKPFTHDQLLRRVRCMLDATDGASMLT